MASDVSNKDGTRDDDQEDAIKREAEQGAHRNERGITPERWAESERAAQDPGELTRAGRHAQQPPGRADPGPEKGREDMDRRVEEQAEVGRRAAESGDPSPRRRE